MKLKVDDGLLGLFAVLLLLLLLLESCCFLSDGRKEANVNDPPLLALLLSFAKAEKPEFEAEDEAANAAKPLPPLELKPPNEGRLVCPKAGAAGLDVAPNAGIDVVPNVGPVGIEVVPKAGAGLGKEGFEVIEKPLDAAG